MQGVQPSVRQFPGLTMRMRKMGWSRTSLSANLMNRLRGTGPGSRAQPPPRATLCRVPSHPAAPEQ
eukprot:3186952-Alexandrium_andersonii.AAC.1